MKVIGVGFGRTGTLSMKEALEELGFGPCYHMVEVARSAAHKKLWIAAAEGRKINWDHLLGDYQSMVDWPGCYFWRGLIGAYPDAKVILTIRNSEAWYESVRETIYPLTRLAGPVTGLLVPSLRNMRRITDLTIWKGTFDERFKDRKYALEIYERHLREVLAEIPPDRLLVFDVRDGWGPLCEFLGVAPPDGKPFPRINERSTQLTAIRIIRIGRVVMSVLAVSLIVLVVWLLIRGY